MTTDKTKVPIPYEPTRTRVSPSPRDLVEKLTPDERVAIDHILEHNLDIPVLKRDFHAAHPNVGEPMLATLVPDVKRRSYLLGLAEQLRGLGDTLDDWITERERAQKETP